MSLRNVRKMLGTTSSLPPLEGNSDEEFEPQFSKGTKSFTFAGLEISSHSESDQEVLQDEEENNVKKTKNNKKNKKKNRRKTKITNNPNKDEELDEIDKCVKEVNDMLGAIPVASTSAGTSPNLADTQKVLFSVKSKYLDYKNELKKFLGSDSLDESGRGKKCRPHNVVKYRRAFIVHLPQNTQFHSVGLSMSLQRRENGYSYFTFDHNRDYQQMHRTLKRDLLTQNTLPLDELLEHTYIEGLLMCTNVMFRAEEYSIAQKILEEVISYFHYIAHPCFNLTDRFVRLEYKYPENRPFFIAILQYLYMLSNKACHRTALELAKLLMNLDPADELAIIYVIDVFALRAREHQWLIDAIEYWKIRDAEYLFTLKYSLALAHFHVAKKSKSDFSRADELLQEALMMYPILAYKFFENCNQEISVKLKDHPYFSTAEEQTYSENTKIAITFYCKLVCWRWREPPVREWFQKNLNVFIQKQDNDPAAKELATKTATLRKYLFRSCPEQMIRHLQVVESMGDLLVEWRLPDMGVVCPWDPKPPTKSIDRYHYV